MATREWATATDRDYDVRGRYPRELYRHADRWLRQQVESDRLGETDGAAAREEARTARAALLALAETAARP